LLAGGEGQRVGGADKGLLPFNGEPLIHWTLASAQQQLGQTPTLISANRNQQRYQTFAPSFADDSNHAGPLAGVAALLAQCQTEWLLTLPCDCPKLPPDFGAKLAQFLLNAKAEHVAAVINDGQRNQNAVLLIRKNQQAALLKYLEHGGKAIHKWLASMATSAIVFDNWPAERWNANTVDALQALIDDD
jgi:molybdopterin-guanine dinucleotide biosynthesis protein A